MPETIKDALPTSQNGTRTVHFGEFEADLHLGEVRKAGNRSSCRSSRSGFCRSCWSDRVSWSPVTSCGCAYGPTRATATSIMR